MEWKVNCNRVRMHIYEFTPSIFRQGRNKGLFKIIPSFDSIEVEGYVGRFINVPEPINKEVFSIKVLSEFKRPILLKIMTAS